ncbi:MAG: transcriptional regulator [Hyphococcus sp.]|nr:MAG: transcriptional regulator [Marinicaulis sp.]
MARPQKAVKRLEAVAEKRDGPHPIDVHVGSRIKLRRMILGLSQESLGKALGLTFQQIQKYEKGVNRIGASRIFEMSQLLEVPVQFFYDDLGDSGWGGASGFAESGERDDVLDLVNSAEGVQLCRYFAAIKDSEVKKRVLDLVKSIAENESP